MSYVHSRKSITVYRWTNKTTKQQPSHQGKGWKKTETQVNDRQIHAIKFLFVPICVYTYKNLCHIKIEYNIKLQFRD